jgi:hypothetical protein
MSSGPGDLREAVERNAQAVMSGNFAQLMADITPEALAEMMKLAAGAGEMSLAQLPAIEGYDISEVGPEGDTSVFEVTFRSAAGTATLAAAWREVLGQWKITAVRLVSLDPAVAGGPDPGG